MLSGDDAFEAELTEALGKIWGSHDAEVFMAKATAIATTRTAVINHVPPCLRSRAT